MTGRGYAMWSLLGTGLRGLRSRFLLTLASALLAAISVAAAVVGPMYQGGAAASYLVTKLRSEPNSLTGQTFSFVPTPTEAHQPAATVVAVRALADATLDNHFGPASVALWSVRQYSDRMQRGDVALLSVTGECAHVALVGRCPQAPGEALILRHDSEFVHLGIGQQLRLPDVKVPLRVVGTYAPRASDENFWFDLNNLVSVPVQTGVVIVPYQPAPLLVSQQTFARVTPAAWHVEAQRRLVVSASTTPTDVREAAQAVRDLHVKQATFGRRASGALTPQMGNGLASISRQALARQSTARSTVTPAVVSVVLVALVLLLRLLLAAMDLRRNELALASLRGYSRRQMWLLGLVEPLLMVIVATPIGLVAGYLCARQLARTWLVPGLPMPLGVASVLSLVVVVLATVVVTVIVVREALSETLAAQIAGVRRPGRSGRWVLMLRLVTLAAATTVLVATLAASKRSSPSAIDLSLPILLAVAAGLVATLAAQAAARRWAAATARRRGVFSYLASRTISRRREGTLVVLPLTAALAVAIFAAGVFTAAADWRSSDAATIVGADASYPTDLSLGQAVALTHSIDPQGRWLMAIASEFDGSNQLLVMDTPRLPRVGLWPAGWTPGMNAGDIARALAPSRPSVVVTGSRVSMTVDNGVTGDFSTLSAELSMTGSGGEPTSVILGPMPPGVSTVSARLSRCDSGCVVDQMSFGGPAALSQAMHGTVAILSVRADGLPVPGFVDQPWRGAQPFLNTPGGVSGQPSVGAGGLRITLDAKSSASLAAVTPTDVPPVRPIVMGRTAPFADASPGTTVHLHASAYRDLEVRPVTRAESIPVLGPVGMLIDYTMLTRDVVVNDATSVVTILARSDTPSSVVAALADHGISTPATLSTTRAVLDSDAFALALNLYLVVTVIVVLLALTGLGANLAVQMSSRRRDAASLRVVGLRRRSIVAAVIAEFVVALGAAALAGVGAGSLAQYVVVRTVTLGYADTQHTPRLLASLDAATMLELLLVVTVGLLVVAAAVAGFTVRGARTASLRENAR